MVGRFDVDSIKVLALSPRVKLGQFASESLSHRLPALGIRHKISGMTSLQSGIRQASSALNCKKKCLRLCLITGKNVVA